MKCHEIVKSWNFNTTCSRQVRELDIFVSEVEEYQGILVIAYSSPLNVMFISMPPLRLYRVCPSTMPLLELLWLVLQ